MITSKVYEASSAPINLTKDDTVSRLISIDAFRGFVMLMMCVSHGYGITALAEQSSFAGFIASLFTHADWKGLHFLDLIQPAFMFMVGMAMSFSLANRKAYGATFNDIFFQVLKRSFYLIVLSQIILSISKNQFQFQLINVLSQIAFTYFLCFLIMQFKFRYQIILAILILAGHWLLFVAFPGTEGPYSQTDNVGAVIDKFILGGNYPGFYVTINFISSTVTTLFGIWTATLLQSNKNHAYKIKILICSALICLMIGLALEPFNPMIKRLWTESFTFYSTGWILILLTFFYVLDINKYHKLLFPLVVVGMNSIFIYCMAMILFPWLDNAIAIFTNRFVVMGNLGTFIQATLVIILMWYFCYWFYKRKIFFKI